jgi:hypothetical protein
METRVSSPGGSESEGIDVSSSLGRGPLSFVRLKTSRLGLPKGDALKSMRPKEIMMNYKVLAPMMALALIALTTAAIADDMGGMSMSPNAAANPSPGAMNMESDEQDSAAMNQGAMGSMSMESEPDMSMGNMKLRMAYFDTPDPEPSGTGTHQQNCRAAQTRPYSLSGLPRGRDRRLRAVPS